MSKKKNKYPIYKMGNFCGYDEYEDGSIKIAPSHYQPLDDALLSEKAVNRLLQSLTEQCHKLLIPIMSVKTHFWDRISEDYSLDSEKYQYSYDPATKMVSRIIKATEETKP